MSSRSQFGSKDGDGTVDIHTHIHTQTHNPPPHTHTWTWAPTRSWRRAPAVMGWRRRMSSSRWIDASSCARDGCPRPLPR